MLEPRPLRVGVLGAARIAPMALIRPARRHPGVQVSAVAARDPGRARAFARKHGIARALPDYAALVADPELDAVYVALPNALHAEWSIRALEAGKHVLCEKPLASNAEEAERMAEAAARSGRLLVEAFHWRHHPLAARMASIMRDGRLGKLERLEVELCVPFLAPGDIRFRYELGGGATMDLGCYAIHMARTLIGTEPRVEWSEARTLRPGVDRWMRAELDFGSGLTARITCSLLSSTLLRLRLRARGDWAQMEVTNPLAPHLFHRLRLRTQGVVRSETVGGRSTYDTQLGAFVRAVREGGEPARFTDDAVANMRVIDAVYEAAGLPRRGSA